MPASPPHLTSTPCSISVPHSAATDAALDPRIAATSLVFAAASRASALPHVHGSTSPYSVRFSEFDPTGEEVSDILSSVLSSSRSAAYRPATPDQLRAAILYARPHTLTSSQRPRQSELTLESVEDRKSRAPFKKIVVGRAMTAPILQVGALIKCRFDVDAAFDRHLRCCLCCLLPVLLDAACSAQRLLHHYTT